MATKRRPARKATAAPGGGSTGARAQKKTIEALDKEEIADGYKKLRAECERRFKKLFDEEFTDDLRSKWLKEFDRLRGEDADARRVLDRFSPRKARAVLRRYGINPDKAGLGALLGHAPTLSVIHHKLTSQGQPPSVGDLNRASYPKFNTLRAWVIHKFGVRWIPREVFWKGSAPDADARVLSDAELAVISVLLDPKARHADIKRGYLPKDILENERVAIARAREHASDPYFEEIKTFALRRGKVPLR